MLTEGYVHSIETFGTVDGPGIRYVVFLQGCPMRCQYCHNPDTWIPKTGKMKSVWDILEDYESCRPFLSNGGLTVTGGEPMLQMEFLTALLEGAKARGIHTCIDTSGITFQEESAEYMEKLSRLMKSTDLVMLDIKHIDEEKHRKLTGHSNQRVLAFAAYLRDKKIPVWIRHVVVPGITMKEEDLLKLGCFLSNLDNMKALDVLPYHDMGKEKYRELGISYPLMEVKPLEKQEALWARNKIIEGMKMRLKEKKNI